MDAKPACKIVDCSAMTFEFLVDMLIGGGWELAMLANLVRGVGIVIYDVPGSCS